MSENQTEFRNATVADFDPHPRPDLIRTLCCAGTTENPHMVPMQLVQDAETPHGICPECGSRAFLEPQPDELYYPEDTLQERG